MQLNDYVDYRLLLMHFQATNLPGQNDRNHFTQEISRERDLASKNITQIEPLSASQSQSLFFTVLPESIQIYIFGFLKKESSICTSVCHAFHHLVIRDVIREQLAPLSHDKEKMILQGMVDVENTMNHELGNVHALDELTKDIKNVAVVKRKLENIVCFLSVYKAHFLFMLSLEENAHYKILIKGNLIEIHHYQKECERHLKECTYYLKRKH
ncbi:hypothetical protein [Parachlamydia acanthamoebae]|uniref:hypothetical protein n=1 Tax=Parachlamydia acanthamoebae TaxID=83552 RepID=UPI0024E27628|nr:hypothetical protein [Parachlamydia acanthamoebae]